MKQIEAVIADLRESTPQIAAQDVVLEDAGLRIIDCREQEEFNNGHIAGSLLVPRAQFELRIEDLLPDKQQTVLIYCASGTRSLFAARTMRELGYTKVSSLSGGIAAWKSAGRAVHTAVVQATYDRVRYQSQMRLPEIGEAGQQKLRSARVLLIGAGGLGSPVALYLAAAGVGTLGIIDHDQVDRSNLQRQILHTSERVGLNKVDSAFIALRALNSEVEVLRYAEQLTPNSARRLFPEYDLIVDGSDNFATRYLVNRICHLFGKQCVHGSVFQWQGQVAVFGGAGPCYECLFPTPPSGELAPNCAEGGVIGAITGVVGASMACEVIKQICGMPTLSGVLASFDLKEGIFETLHFEKDPSCACCSNSMSFADIAQAWQEQSGQACLISS